jgi:hypothetical protein
MSQQGARPGRLTAGLLAAVTLSIGFARAAPAAAPMGKDVSVTIGMGVPMAPATKTDPFDFDLTTPPAMAGGAPVIMTVSVTDLAARGANETLTDASKRKADAVAAAINAVLPKVAGQPAATVTQKPAGFKEIVGMKPPFLDAMGRVIRKAEPIYAPAMQSFVTIQGLYTVPAVPAKPAAKGNPAQPAVPGVAAIKQTTNPTQEVGDAVKIGAGKPGAPPTPTPSTGGMGSTGMSAPASGMSAGGTPSFVYFGVEETAIGDVTPYAGETASQVLQSLGSQLDQTGVATTYDSLTDTLTIDTIPAGDTLVWGSTDSGLDFRVAFGAGVPEPGAWMLLLAGVGVPGAAIRRRRAREARAAARCGGADRPLSMASAGAPWTSSP